MNRIFRITAKLAPEDSEKTLMEQIVSVRKVVNLIRVKLQPVG